MIETRRSTPFEQGFRMPAEWDVHAATWVSWPFDDELWEGYLDAVRSDMAGLVALVSRHEPVWLNVCDEDSEQDARLRLAEVGADLGRITFHRVELNDAWFRDNGPIFVRDPQGRVALTDWGFNAWGGKYAPWDDDDRAPRAVARTLQMARFEMPVIIEGGALEINGQGVCLTTRSCLLTQTRNPNMTETDYEAVLRDGLGVMHVVWLEGGMIDDHTDGHIDTVVRFVDDGTIVCAVEEDEADPDYPTLRHNLEALRSLRSPEGTPYRVIELPQPRNKRVLGGKRLPMTYANFYIGNGFVAVPVYGDPNDDRALDVLRPLFPGREVIGLSANGLITGGGAFHCVTQQQPLGEVAHASE